MNGSTLRQLSYVSTATRVLEDADLEDLVIKARAKNNSLGITGLLLYNGLNFMQTLEGESPVIEELMQSISSDGRHTGLVVVSDQEIADRTFADWNLRCTRTHVPHAVDKIANGHANGRDVLEAGWPTGIPPQLQKLYDAFHTVAGV